MRIGIIGGVERSEQHYERLAERAGHKLMFHGGHVGGRGRETLSLIIDQCDLVIVVTDVNSHGAVQFARRRMQLLGRTPILLRRLGTARFSTLLDELQLESPEYGTVGHATVRSSRCK